MKGFVLVPLGVVSSEVPLPRNRGSSCGLEMAGLPKDLLPGDGGVLDTTWKMPGEVLQL